MQSDNSTLAESPSSPETSDFSTHSTAGVSPRSNQGNHDECNRRVRLCDPDDPERFVALNDNSCPMFTLYKKHVASFWTPWEFKMDDDQKDWQDMKPDEQHFIEYVLAFFAGSDGLVIDNLATNFMREVTHPTARLFYTAQIFMEGIHSLTYTRLLEALVSDNDRRRNLLAGIQTVPSIKRKAEWTRRWIDDQDRSFPERLVAFAAVEGIFFSSSFCALFWLKKKGKMPGLTFSNEVISRDEGLHCEFACLLLNEYVERPSADRIQTIVREAVEVELTFVQEALPQAILGINQETMFMYVQFVADHLLEALGVPKVYLTENPFEWMEAISLGGKSNFFERTVSEYQKANVVAEDNTFVFSVSEDW
jgi:ribonucleoside-diphosphate reductase beta chain